MGDWVTVYFQLAEPDAEEFLVCARRTTVLSDSVRAEVFEFKDGYAMAWSRLNYGGIDEIRKLASYWGCPPFKWAHGGSSDMAAGQGCAMGGAVRYLETLGADMIIRVDNEGVPDKKSLDTLHTYLDLRRKVDIYFDMRRGGTTT